MQILITGITGRIGANIAAALVKKGHQVKGLVWPRDPRISKLKTLGITLIEGSLTKQKDVEKTVKDSEIIYHLGAALQGGGPFTNEEYFDINVKGTFYMLEAAKENKSLKQFIFASSDALYDKYLPEGMKNPIKEDTMARKPAGWYPLSKSIGEEMCNSYIFENNLPITILRFAKVEGAGEIIDFPQFYLSNFKNDLNLKHLWNGKEKLIILRTKNGLSFKKHIAEVRDITDGCLCAFNNSKSFGETFQLAGPKPFSWEETIPYLSKKLNLPFVEGTPEGPPTFYEFDISKSKNILGFNPKYDIKEMIEEALKFKSGKSSNILPTD